MLGFLFKKNKRIDDFAAQMADEFYSAIPKDAIGDCLGNKKDKRKAKAFDNKINDMALQLQQFKLREKVGVYGKARLHLAFMTRLELLGYEQGLAKKINEMILIKSM
jgi:hypothetical protein